MAASAPGLVLLSFFVALPQASGTGGAPRAVPFHIELDAPAGCSSPEAAVRSVEARNNHTRRAQPDESATRFRLRIVRAGGRVRGALSVVDERGETEARTVEGTTCDEIVEALALTMALVLTSDAKPPAPRPAPRASEPQAGAGASRSRGSGTVSRAAAPAPDTTAPLPPPAAATAGPTPPGPPAVAAAAAPAAPAPVEPAPPIPPPATPPPPTVTAPADVSPPADEAGMAWRGMVIGVGAVAAQPVSPPISLGATLSLAATWADTAADGNGADGVPDAVPDAVPILVGLSLLHAANNYLQSPDGFVASWTAAALSACPPLGLGAPVVIQPCARATAGWLTATDRSIAPQTEVRRTLFGVGGFVRLGVPLGGGFSVEVTGGVEVPLLKRRFILTTPDTTVGQTPTVSAWAGVGITRDL